MGRLMREHPWHLTPVGPPETWPASLRSLVAALLQCQLPMYIAWGPDYTQFYNDAYRAILGDKHPAALGNATQITWSEIWPTIGPMWAEVLQGKPIGFEDLKLTIQRFGYPEDCYFNSSYSPVVDDAGSINGVMVTFAETTHRVANEQRLRFVDELSQETRNLSDPHEIMRVTAERLGRHLRVNRCAYAQVHADEDTFDLLGDYNDGVQSIVGRYRFANFGQSVLRLMREGVPYVNHDVETDPVTAGSDLSAYAQTRIASVICLPLHKEGRLVAAIAVHQSSPRRWTDAEVELLHTVGERCWEALERLRSQNAVQEEARLLELLNRTGETLVRELDIRTVLQRVTDAATELTGAKFGAFFYNGISDTGEAYVLYTLSGAPREAFEGFGHPRPTPIFNPTFRGEPPIRCDDVLQDSRYGRWGPHHGMPPKHLPVRSYLAVSVVSRSGEPIGGLFFGHPEVGVFTERSERLAVGIASHAAIALDNAQLYEQSQRLAEERRELLDRERAARVDAERANSLKDEFLATLSHELRTPLSAIVGWIHIFRMKFGKSNPELLKGVDVIERSTKAQVQLIDDILDVSRIRAGKLVMERRPVSPIDFVQSAVDMIRPTFGDAGIELQLDVRGVGMVAGDAARMQQVVWNLLSNAAKFTPAGGRVSVVLSEADGHVVLRVTDTGVGIRKELLPLVFDRFRQADSSTTRKFGGLGLGLSIVKHIVEAHGGSICAHSEGEGQGTTFEVCLPLIERAAPAQTPSVLPPLAENIVLDGLRVLLVEDEPHSRELLEHILQEHGAQVKAVGSAHEALHVLSIFRPSVLVSDLGLPGADGYELLRAIRRDAPADLQNIPAIAVSAFVRPEDRARTARAGFEIHISKPANPADVIQAVRQVVA